MLALALKLGNYKAFKTGRGESRQGKASINLSLPPLLERLKASSMYSTQLERKRALLVGGKESFRIAISKMQWHRISGYQLS